MKRGEKGEQSRNKLITCAADLFWRNGYSATGINDILANAELPKGSFYFHFKSKKDLAIAAAIYFENKILRWLQQTAKDRDWESFVTEFTETMLQSAEKSRHFGCPFAVMGLETAFYEPEVALHYSDSMNRIRGVFESVLLFSGISAETAQMLARCTFAAYEGYLLQYRISKDIMYLQSMRTDLIRMIQDHQAASR